MWRFSCAHKIWSLAVRCVLMRAKRERKKFMETQLRPQLAWSGWYPTGSCRPAQTQYCSSETQLLSYNAITTIAWLSDTHAITQFLSYVSKYPMVWRHQMVKGESNIRLIFICLKITFEVILDYEFNIQLKKIVQ